jgi:ligand-binding sensor domain-containing protein
MGTNGGGLSRLSKRRFTNITTSTGLPSNFVRSLYADDDGWLWAGTEGMGLARLDPGEWTNERTSSHRIVSIRQNDGLFDNGVHQILDDGLGRLWMSSYS